jgi:outer membrane protein assembly factor BamB
MNLKTSRKTKWHWPGDLGFVRDRTAASLALLFLGAVTLLADDWPQWLGPNRDAVWRETGIVRSFPSKGPLIRWRASLGAGYSGPAVAKGRVFVTDRQLTPGSKNPDNPFARGTIPGSERVLCLNDSNGEILWTRQYPCAYSVSYPAGPRATPVVDGAFVYTLGAEGNLLCLEAATGKEVWSKDFPRDYGIKTPLWGFAAHPLIDGRKLICLVGGQGSVVVALDKQNGKELWRALSAKEPGYCPPMIYEAGGTRQLIVWHPEAITSLNPDTGEVYWTEPWAIQSGLSVPTPRQSGPWLFFTAFYNGSRLLRLDETRPGFSEVWASKKSSEKDTTELHSIFSTPFIENGYIYGVCSYGQLRCLKLETGERVWETFAATTDGSPVRWANAFLVKNGDRFFLANEKGDLIIARLTPAGYEEISRAHLLDPTNTAAGRPVVWSHPAFANRSVYARNDKEIVCASLADGSAAP